MAKIVVVGDAMGLGVRLDAEEVRRERARLVRRHNAVMRALVALEELAALGVALPALRCPHCDGPRVPDPPRRAA